MSEQDNTENRLEALERTAKIHADRIKYLEGLIAKLRARK